VKVKKLETVVKCWWTLNDWIGNEIIGHSKHDRKHWTLLFK
jgi:hypothetical protein